MADATLTRTPLFVVGAQRSGTTMLRLMLNRHPELYVPFESGFITEFHPRLPAYGDLADAANARRLLDDIANYPLVRDFGRMIKDPDAILARPHRTYAELVDAVFSVEAQRHGKTWWGDKTPSYVTELDILWEVFPGCRIVHLVRDGRDVAMSNRTLEWGIHSLPRVAADWRWKTTIAHKVGSVLYGHYLEVRYEDLVLSPEEQLRRICRFIGTDFTPAMLAYHEDGAGDMPAEAMKWHGNSVRAPDPSLVYGWKRRMSPADRIIFEQVAGDALDLFGYPRDRRSSTWGSRAKNFYYANVSRW